MSRQVAVSPCLSLLRGILQHFIPFMGSTRCPKELLHRSWWGHSKALWMVLGPVGQHHKWATSNYQGSISFHRIAWDWATRLVLTCWSCMTLSHNRHAKNSRLWWSLDLSHIKPVHKLFPATILTTVLPLICSTQRQRGWQQVSFILCTPRHWHQW